MRREWLRWGFVLGANVPQLHAALTTRNKDFVEICSWVVDHDSSETWFELNGRL